jgi:hypothetical protein
VIKQVAVGEQHSLMLTGTSTVVLVIGATSPTVC